MALSDRFIERNKAKAEGATVMGQPVSEMTRDELLAVIGHMGDRDLAAEAAQRQREMNLIAGMNIA